MTGEGKLRITNTARRFGTRHWVVTRGTVTAGVLILGLCTVWKPLLAVALMALVGFAVIGMHGKTRLAGTFLTVLGILLIGFAFLGRGFAYVNVPPAFIGDVVLGFGFAALVASGVILKSMRTSLSWLLIAFMSWGALGLALDIQAYGLDALRDSVIWAYGAFALLVTASLLRTRWLVRVPRHYSSLLPVFLCWAPIAVLITRLEPSFIPAAPGSDVPILFVYTSQVATHLSGAAAFILLGLYHSRKRDVLTGLAEWFWWLAWVVGFFAVATSRAAILSIALPLMLVLLFRPRSKWKKPALVLATITAAFLVMNLSFSQPLTKYSSGREISPAQVVANVKSIFEGDSRDDFQTRSWRLNWWGDIVDYTFFGEFFWRGKGFGVNLATDDGYQLDVDESLRSPHNGHMTVLARMGVPGFILWLLLQGAFGATCVLAYARAQKSGLEWWARIDLWILAYWSAFLIEAAFGVSLEGPQAGIWFWSLLGFGIAVFTTQEQVLGAQSDEVECTQPRRRHHALTSHRYLP